MGNHTALFSDPQTVQTTLPFYPHDSPLPPADSLLKAAHISLSTQTYLYQGEIQSGQINGKGVCKSISGIVYQGTFQNGCLKKGTIYAKETKIPSHLIQYWCQGEFTSPTMLSGDAKYLNFTDGYSIEAQFAKGKANGKGKYLDQRGHTYKGDFSLGMRHGEGVYQDCFGTITGSFERDLPNGRCQIAFSNGDAYFGEIKAGVMNGQGRYEYADGTIYTGGFLFGCQWGDCVIEYPPKRRILRYEGEISQGLYNGRGVLHFEDGSVFKGYFSKGRKNGGGVVIYAGNRWRCFFQMDELVGQFEPIFE